MRGMKFKTKTADVGCQTEHERRGTLVEVPAAPALSERPKSVGRSRWFMALILSGGSMCVGQGQAELNRRLDLALEKKEDTTSRVVDASYIFHTGDKIRFRLRSAINGYLYVMNQGSSGNWSQLFPRNELAQSRKVSPGHDYVVPATGAGWFQVTGPAGYDEVYFLISPIDLGKSMPAANQTAAEPADTAEPAAFSTATPRCDDELFRARGECLDSNAGPKPLKKEEAVPDRFAKVPLEASRDLIVVNSPKEISVSSTGPFDGPTIFRFRIAHK